MKKFLSLVMALIMVMSLVTVASAADYTDAADVEKTEAVDVMSAVGVFQGSAGKFNPKAILNRAEAAKLIAYLDLGEDVAEALPAVQAFSDVPATHWAAKYIAYCTDAGYINGVGNGQFNPTGKLTGYQFGKLLLCVLGYDAKIEAFTGASWTIAVAKLMQANDINDGVKAAPSADLTREDAAQYCLNALQATTVGYADKGTTITVGGVDIVTGAKAATPKTELGSTSINATKTVGGVPTVELGEKLYDGDLIKSTSAYDAFGRQATNWTYDKTDVGTFGKTAKIVFTTAQDEDDITAALKGYVISAGGDYKINDDTKLVGALTISKKGSTGVTFNTTDSIAKNLADATENGKVVEIYTSKNTISDIVVIASSVAEITAVSTNKAGDVTYTLKDKFSGATVSKKDFADEDRDDQIVNASEVKKGDIVTYSVAANGSTYYTYPTTTLTGAVSKAKDNDYAVVDGTKYPQSNAANITADKESRDMIVDQYGVIVYGDWSKKTSDAIYIVKIWNKSTGYGNSVPMAQIVDQKGVVTEVELDAKGLLEANVYEKGVYEYYMTGDDTAVMTEVTDTAKVNKVTNSEIKTSTKKLTGAGATYYVADDVTFINMKNSGAKLKVTTATGVQAVKSVPSGTYMISDDGEVISVFIPQAADSSVAKDDLLFAAKTSSSVYATDDKGVSGKVFDLYQGGEKISVMVKNNSVASVGFYSYSVDSSTGRYDLTSESDNVYRVSVDVDADGAVYTINKDGALITFDTAGQFADAVVASDVEFVDTTDNGFTSLATLKTFVEANAADEKFFDVWALYDSKTEEIVRIYVSAYTGVA